MSAVDAATQVDLSGYTVSLQRSPTMEWSWTATTPTGEQMRGLSGEHGRGWRTRANAEREALNEIERHAIQVREDEVLSGEELRHRVQGNNQ